MEAITSPDIDRGWAFVVLFVTCVARAVIYGVCTSTAILYSTFLDDLNESPVFISWIVNLTVAVNLVCTHFGTVLRRIIGIQATAVTGCLISSAGLLATSCAPTVYWLFLTHGLITGIGYSLVYVVQYDIIAQYFVKHRKIAFSLHGLTTTLSTFAYSPLLFALSERYHWRGAFMILSAMNLNVLLFAAIAVKPRQVIDDARCLEKFKPNSEADNDDDDDDCQAFNFRSQLSQFREDLRILCNVNFSFYLFSNVLLSAGVSAVCTHVTSYARVRGLSNIESVFLPSILAIGNVVCRALIGIILEIFKLSIPLPYILMFTIAGILTTMYGFINSFIPIAVTTACIGCLFGVYIMFVELTIILVGVENLSVGLSFVGICSAIGYFSGGPVAAILYEKDPSYVSTFVVIGLGLVIGAVINLPLIIKVKGERLTIIVRHCKQNR